MTRTLVLYPGEDVLAPVDDTFVVARQHINSQIATAFGVKPIHQGRKTCLSCGAIQSVTGELPCGH